jgi:hypothetical protein
LIGGQSTQFYASGSNTTTTFNRQINNNFVGGNFCIVSASANGDNSSLLGTIVYGNNLRVNGNSPYNAGVGTAGYGSTFIGRFNDETGTKALTANTIFAVGTGTASSGFFRKTGFLIDSGSNTFVEGTLNVSGSTSFNGAVNITGSLTSSLTLGYVWVGGAGNVSTLVATSSFAGGSVPAGTISGSSQITALGFVSSSVTASSLITASVNLNTITFTKGDASTFAITVNTGSGGGTVPAGTVSSSAQILGYNIFATTGSNTFTGQQIIRSGGGLELAPTIGGGGTDNYINLASLNQQTLMIANTSVSSGYQSGSLLQISAGTGSNGYGFSGSAGFQMDSLYNGYKASMKVQSINGVGSQLTGVGDTIIFVGREGFGDTNADKFQVDADSIDLNGAVSLSGSLTIENGTGNLFVHGNKQFNVGAFQSNVSQSGSANVSQSMNFEVTDISEGVSIVSNSQITLAHSGTYNIQFSAQILADTGADDVYIWLKKNGTNVSASAGHVVLANNEELIASWNYVVSAAASDYFEIVWQNTNGDAILLTENASGNIPSVPSVILTVTQVR